MTTIATRGAASRRHSLPPFLVLLGLLSSPALAIVSITPQPNAAVGINPGHHVEFRKGTSGSISFTGDHIATGDQLFALSPSDPAILAIATDNGIATINYLDTGGGNDFPNPRDVGIGPLTAVKTTPAQGSNGTFVSNGTDNDFAMEASGYIYIPAAGNWTFTVKSDDGCRLIMGANQALVGEFDGGRGAFYGGSTGGNPGDPGVSDFVVSVPSPGFYPYQLLWEQGGGGAMGQFAVAQGSFPEPTSFGIGFLPAGSHLVGDTASGGLAVYQTILPLGVLAATGDQVAGEKPGTRFVSFGAASFDDAVPSVLATIKPQTFKAEQVVINTGFQALVHVGDAAPGVTNATFLSFKDPVCGGGHCAFLASMTPGFAGVTSANNNGIWSNAFGPLALVARIGSPAPGVTGATFGSFVSLALPQAGGSVFVAKLAGVPAASSLSLWRETASGPVLLLRQGDTINLGFGPNRAVTSFAALMAVTGSPDQTRFASDGSIPVHITFADKLQAIVSYPGAGGSPIIVAFTNSGPATPAGAEFKTFSVVSQSDDGFAFLGTLVPKVAGVTPKNATGIFAGPRSGLNAIVRLSDSAPGTSSTFQSFSDPAFVGTNTVAFIGKLTPGNGITTTNATGIWANFSGSLQLVAQQGGNVPDVPGAQFLSFTSLTLPDTTPASGPIFLAKLAPGLGGVTKTNNIGLWATDSSGVTHLLVRTGDSVTVHTATKTVMFINVLSAAMGSPGQPRAVNSAGFITYVLQFTDRTEALYLTQLPTSAPNP